MNGIDIRKGIDGGLPMDLDRTSEHSNIFLSDPPLLRLGIRL